MMATDPFPLRRDTVIELSLDAIEGNHCDRVPSIELISGTTPARCDTVTYRLDAAARKKYRFRTSDTVSCGCPDGKPKLGYMIVKRKSASELVIRLDCKTSTAFAPIPLDFHFSLIGKPKAPVLCFDPGVGSGGGPRV